MQKAGAVGESWLSGIGSPMGLDREGWVQTETAYAHGFGDLT